MNNNLKYIYMNKIKLLLICFFITNAMFLNAQNNWCGSNKVNDTFISDATTFANQNVTMESFQNAPQLVLKVHFYDVRPDQDDQEHPFLTETTALNAVAELNRNYNAFNIFFKYDGMDSFLSDDFYEIYYGVDQNDENSERGDFMDFTNDNNYYTEGAINVYSVDFITQNIWAYFKLNGNYTNFTTIVSRWDYIDNPEYPFVMSHEVGHNFQLAHTFKCLESPPESGNFICENVTREPYLPDGITPNPDYNADTYGDKIIDTYASPQSYNRTNDCVYDDILVDQVGEPYSTHPPQAKNFMSYAHGCQQEFTPGQIAFMRWYINQIDGIPEITAIINHDPEILYKPYKGEYYNAGPSTAHNPPLFQYGFDYVFYDTIQADIYNQPSPYEDTSFWYGIVTQSYNSNYNTPIVHQNHSAFKILQLDNNPRMCYNNFNKTPNGGTLIKFLDGVPNANVTISQQDSLQINNANYIQNLTPGLYTIQKTFNDGTDEDIMILKENN